METRTVPGRTPEVKVKLHSALFASLLEMASLTKWGSDAQSVEILFANSWKRTSPTSVSGKSRREHP
jgi:hypothetical protein